MNNCPKCGNPLQPGTVSCPICGTNLEQAKAEPQVVNQNINTPVSKPIAEVKEQVQTASVTQPTKIEPTSEPKPVTQAPIAQTNVEPVKTVEQPKTIEQSQMAESPKPVAEPASVTTPVEANAVSQPVASVASAPVASQGASQVSAAPVTEVNPVSIQTSPTIATPTPVQPSAPVAPVPEVSQASVTPSQPINTVTNPTPVGTVTPAAPTVTKIDQGTPVPSIPASLNNSNNGALNASTLKVEAPKEEKKSIKIGKKNIIIIAVAALIIVGTVLYLTLGKTTSMKPNNNTNNANENANINAISYAAGYRFNLPSEWSIIEDGNNVLLKNSDENITLKLENLNESLENLTEERIKKYLGSLTSTENIEILSTQISGKDAYLVNVTINNLPVQIYLINSGTKLITGATIIYQNEDVKTSSDATITELLGTLSYSDESVKAIGTLNMYSNIFNIYKGIINYQEPTIPDNNIVNNPENNNVNNNGNNPDQPVQGETENNGENNIEPSTPQPESGNN